MGVSRLPSPILYLLILKSAGREAFVFAAAQLHNPLRRVAPGSLTGFGKPSRKDAGEIEELDRRFKEQQDRNARTKK
jgi:hypothetical protein